MKAGRKVLESYAAGRGAGPWVALIAMEAALGAGAIVPVLRPPEDGSFKIESLHLDKIIVILNVR